MQEKKRESMHDAVECRRSACDDYLTGDIVEDCGEVALYYESPDCGNCFEMQRISYAAIERCGCHGDSKRSTFEKRCLEELQ